MHVYTYRSFNDLYDSVVDDMMENASKNIIKTSRDGNVIAEYNNVVLELLDATQNIPSNKYKKFSMVYALAEHIWYEAATNKVKPILQFTSNWKRFSDDGVHVNSNYGWCIRKKYNFDQWENIKSLLSICPDTRQAIVHIKEPNNEKSLDVNCTCYLRFYIDKGKLCMTTHMRSNDIFYGTPYDVFQFTLMQWQMAMELDIPIGSYTHVVDSLHMYERDYLKYKK